MPTTERIPRAMAEKFATITALTDAFCDKQLNGEYRELIRRLVGSLARKRPSPLLNGQENVPAAAAVYAIGRVNFLYEASHAPHCPPKIDFEFFGVAASTGQNKSNQISRILARSMPTIVDVRTFSGGLAYAVSSRIWDDVQ